jgi:hypothetical protein
MSFSPSSFGVKIVGKYIEGSFIVSVIEYSISQPDSCVRIAYNMAFSSGETSTSKQLLQSTRFSGNHCISHKEVSTSIKTNSVSSDSTFIEEGKTISPKAGISGTSTSYS